MLSDNSQSWVSVDDIDIKCGDLIEIRELGRGIFLSRELCRLTSVGVESKLWLFSIVGTTFLPDGGLRETGRLYFLSCDFVRIISKIEGTVE